MEQSNSSLSTLGVSVEIADPSQVALPISLDTFAGETFLTFQVLITNNSQSHFPLVYRSLTPKIQTLDLAILEAQANSNIQLVDTVYNGVGIPPRKSLFFPVTAKLFQQGGQILFQIVISDYLKTQDSPDISWSFELAHVVTYQLQFIYSLPKEEFLFFNSHNGEVSTIDGSTVEPLVTSALTIHLVESRDLNNSIISFNNLLFQALVSQPNNYFSSTELNNKIPVQFGIKVTNSTPNTVCLTSFESVIPYLVNSKGLVKRVNSGGSLGWIGPIPSNFHSVAVSESVAWFLDGTFELQANGKVQLTVYGYRTIWLFRDLEFETYKLQLVYRSPSTRSDILFENLWTGMVCIPTVEISLIQGA